MFTLLVCHFLNARSLEDPQTKTMWTENELTVSQKTHSFQSGKWTACHMLVFVDLVDPKLGYGVHIQKHPQVTNT